MAKPTFCSRCLTQEQQASLRLWSCAEYERQKNPQKRMSSGAAEVGNQRWCGGGRGEGGGGGGEVDKSVNRSKKEDRVRTSVRQTTLRSALDLQHSTRWRSQSPERRRSGETTTPPLWKCRSRRGSGDPERRPDPRCGSAEADEVPAIRRDDQTPAVEVQKQTRFRRSGETTRPPLWKCRSRRGSGDPERRPDPRCGSAEADEVPAIRRDDHTPHCGSAEAGEV